MPNITRQEAVRREHWSRAYIMALSIGGLKDAKDTADIALEAYDIKFSRHE